MTQTLKEGDKVVLIGVLLGKIIATDSGEVVALGQGKTPGMLAEVDIMKVRLECGDVVSVPATHVHIPA